MDFPAGVNFYTGRTSLSRRHLEERQIAILIREGFEEIITPVLEYYQGAGDIKNDERIYKFPDQATGRMLALRWDFTFQTAQLAAARMKQAGSVCRWFYRGNVFRAIKAHAGQKRQIYQVGAESLGDPSLESTARMIELAVTLTEASGLSDFNLVVGHVGFVEQLMNMIKLPESGEPAFRNILQRKDLSGLEKMADRFSLSSTDVEAVRRSMYLLGRKETLDEAEAVFKDGCAAGVMEDLRGILRLADKASKRIIFDLTEPRGFDYYTGVMFQIVVPKIGQEVCRGGRYDNLLDQFGCSTPAIGFAADLDLVLQAVEGQDRETKK